MTVAKTKFARMLQLQLALKTMQTAKIGISFAQEMVLIAWIRHALTTRWELSMLPIAMDGSIAVPFIVPIVKQFEHARAIPDQASLLQIAQIGYRDAQPTG